jgi:acyl carrier protein
MWVCFGFIMCLTAIAFLIWLLDPNLRSERAYETELTLREPISDREWIVRYFPDEELAIVTVRVRHIFSDQMGFAAEQMLPADDFGFFWAELDAAPLLAALECEFGIFISDKDAEATRPTIRQVSELVKRLRAEQFAVPDRPRE